MLFAATKEKLEKKTAGEIRGSTGVSQRSDTYPCVDAVLRLCNYVGDLRAHDLLLISIISAKVKEQSHFETTLILTPLDFTWTDFNYPLFHMSTSIRTK